MDTPEIELNCNGKTLRLNWDNTVVRLFGDPALDHIEYRDEECLWGLKGARVVLDSLIEHDFPRRYNPLPDETTIDWWFANNDVSGEIDDLNSGS